MVNHKAYIGTVTTCPGQREKGETSKSSGGAPDGRGTFNGWGRWGHGARKETQYRRDLFSFVGAIKYRTVHVRNTEEKRTVTSYASKVGALVAQTCEPTSTHSDTSASLILHIREIHNKTARTSDYLP